MIENHNIYIIVEIGTEVTWNCTVLESGLNADSYDMHLLFHFFFQQ
jgi:hypothetical protein